MLWLPSAQFTQTVDNLGNASTAPGTAVTSGTSNAVGTAVTALSALAFDCELITLHVQTFSIVGAVAKAMLDVLYDPAGGTSWSVIIPNLIIGGTTSTGTGYGTPRQFNFPIWIPAGSSIGLQVRGSNATALPGSVTVFVSGGVKKPGLWWCGQKVIDIGTTTGTTSGVSHTAGNTGAYSSWASLGSTLSQSAGAVQFSVQNAQSASTAIAYYYELGIGSNAIAPPTFWVVNTSENGVCEIPGPWFCDIPAGSQLQVRGTASGTAQAHDVAAYVVI